MEILEVVGSIIVDGTTAEEYAATEEGRTVSCHIASEVGKEFSVKLTNNWDRELRCHLSVDGVKVEKRTIAPGHSKRIKGVDSASGTSYLPFKFGSLRLTDDEDALLAGGRKELQEFGTIRVDCFRIAKVPSVNDQSSILRRQKRMAIRTINNSKSPIHEKSKKLGGHITELGDAIAYPSNGSRASFASGWAHKLLDPLDDPYIRLVWHYLPKDVLQARGIMPWTVERRIHTLTPNPAGPSNRSPEGNRETVVDDGASTNVEEESTKQEVDEGGLAIIKAEVAQLEAALAAKRTALETQLQSTQGNALKREQSPIRLAKALHGDVIDLTLDD